MNIKELYQEIILEHGKNPRNLRKTENFNKDAMGKNPLCGDNVHVFLKLDENKKVEDISFGWSVCPSLRVNNHWSNHHEPQIGHN